MENKFHAMIIENSLNDPKILDNFQVLSTKTTKDTPSLY
jgi:hypothetical protein